jgi:hypothetical protein
MTSWIQIFMDINKESNSHFSLKNEKLNNFFVCMNKIYCRSGSNNYILTFIYLECTESRTQPRGSPPWRDNIGSGRTASTRILQRSRSCAQTANQNKIIRIHLID